MQVIGLVNMLLSRDKESLNRRLHLQRYTVVPLAPDVGLLGWMDGTDTMHGLISDFRKSQKILVDLEYRMMLQVCVFRERQFLTSYASTPLSGRAWL